MQAEDGRHGTIQAGQPGPVSPEHTPMPGRCSPTLPQDCWPTEAQCAPQATRRLPGASPRYPVGGARGPRGQTSLPTVLSLTRPGRQTKARAGLFLRTQPRVVCV